MSHHVRAITRISTKGPGYCAKNSVIQNLQKQFYLGTKLYDFTLVMALNLANISLLYCTNKILSQLSVQVLCSIVNFSTSYSNNNVYEIKLRGAIHEFLTCWRTSLSGVPPLTPRLVVRPPTSGFSYAPEQTAFANKIQGKYCLATTKTLNFGAHNSENI